MALKRAVWYVIVAYKYTFNRDGIVLYGLHLCKWKTGLLQIQNEWAKQYNDK